MHDWNVVVSVHDGGYKRARQILEEFGRVSRTDFYNMLMLQVDDISAMLENLRERLSTDDEVRMTLARVMPVSCSFTFQTPEEFETKAGKAVLPWLPQLANKSWHVRMHRRGFKGRLSSHDEERFLDQLLLEELAKAGTPGHISFEDPDVVIAVETVSQQAGLALWTRQDLRKYPFLKID